MIFCIKPKFSEYVQESRITFVQCDAAFTHIRLIRFPRDAAQ